MFLYFSLLRDVRPLSHLALLKLWLVWGNPHTGFHRTFRSKLCLILAHDDSRAQWLFYVFLFLNCFVLHPAPELAFLAVSRTLDIFSARLRATKKLLCSSSKFSRFGSRFVLFRFCLIVKRASRTILNMSKPVLATCANALYSFTCGQDSSKQIDFLPRWKSKTVVQKMWNEAQWTHSCRIARYVL